MKYRIKFLQDAVDDRDDIKAYLLQFDESTVQKFFALLKERIERLKTFPYSCPVYEDDTDYRVLVVREYLVFYVVDDVNKMVEVHRIFHESRNIRRWL